MGRESDNDAAFVHDLKLRLTAISGYAQLLERQIQQSEYATEKQRNYIARLRRVIDELARTIRDHEAKTRARQVERRDPEDGNGSSSRNSSDCMSN